MIARRCGVKVVTAVTGEARQPSPKSPWSGGEKEVSYVGALVEVVPIGMNGFFYLLSENYTSNQIQTPFNCYFDTHNDKCMMYYTMVFKLNDTVPDVQHDHPLQNISSE